MRDDLQNRFTFVRKSFLSSRDDLQNRFTFVHQVNAQRVPSIAH